MQNTLSFESLPLWTGTHTEAKKPEKFPFALGIHPDGFIQQNTPQEVQDQVVAHYRENDYNFITPPPGASEWANRLGEAYFNFIGKFLTAADKGSFLEIGAGSTYLGNRFIESSHAENYLIVDPSVPEESEGHKNLQIIRDYYTKDLVGEQKFNFIISLNTLEHVPNPAAFLEDIKHALTSDGQFFLVFPNIEDQFLIGDFNSLLHEHINYFSPTSAHKLIESVGFSIAGFESREDTLFYVLKHGENSSHSTEQNQAELLGKANAKFNHCLETVRAFLEEAHQERKKVAFHGATNGLNNILSLLGAEKYDFEVFDGDHLKVGRYIPMCKTPIKHFSDSSYVDCDKVMISAMTYFHEIKKQLIETHGFAPDAVLALN